MKGMIKMFNWDDVQYIPCKETNYKADGRISSDIKYLVIHYTANNGDTAENNAIYFSRETVKASAHFFVSRKSVYQSVLLTDTAWHCGTSKEYKHSECRNTNSIGIELCSWFDPNGGYYYFDNDTMNTAAELTKYLMTRYNIPLKNVLRHYDVTGKNCPAPFVKFPEQWDKFRKMLLDKESDTMDQATFNAMANNWLSSRDELPVNDWASEFWNQMKEQGILDGSSPLGFVTRQQLAKVITTLQEKYAIRE